MSENESPAAGHRARQRKKLIEHGGYTLSDKEIVEMLLYYLLPRIDTKPLAAELLSKFGSIKGILDALPEDLCAVKGMTVNAEVFFMLLRQVSLRDFGAKGTGDMRDPKNAVGLIVRVFLGQREESVFAIYVDGEGRMLDGEMVFRGELSSVKFPLRAVTEGVLRNRGAGVILAHNHPGGEVVPSADDILTTERVAAHLAANDIKLIEHYIVAGKLCGAMIADRVFDASDGDR